MKSLQFYQVKLGCILLARKIQRDRATHYQHPPRSKGEHSDHIRAFNRYWVEQRPPMQGDCSNFGKTAGLSEYMESPAGKGFDIRDKESPFTESDPTFRELTGIQQGDELQGYHESKGIDSPWWADMARNYELGPFMETHEVQADTYQKTLWFVTKIREMIFDPTKKNQQIHLFILHNYQTYSDVCTVVKVKVDSPKITYVNAHRTAYVVAFRAYKRRDYFSRKALEVGKIFLTRAQNKGDREALRRVAKLYEQIRGRIPEPVILEYAPVIEDLSVVNDKRSRCLQEDDSYQAEHASTLGAESQAVPCFLSDGSKLPFPELFPHRARKAQERKERFVGLLQWLSEASPKLLSKAFKESGRYCDGKWLVDYVESGPFVQRANNVKPYRTSKWTVVERHLDPDDRLVTTGQAIVLKYLARAKLGWKISPKFKSLAKQCADDLGLTL